MLQVSVHKTQIQFARLIEQARPGGEILIFAGGVPIARLSAAGSTRGGRRFGAVAGRVQG
jgi:antitoxin (DNA-binding transcriptional repressor) of toxin-antitoxin stability system